MILFFYNHFNKLSKKNKIVITTAVAVVFTIVYGCSIWQQFFADTLEGYVPDNSLVYLHLNLSSTKIAVGFDEFTQRILTDFNLSGINTRQIKREVALICLPINNNTSCGLIIRTNSPEALESFLKDKQVKYKALDFWHNRLAIYGDDLWLQAVPQKKTTLARAIRKETPVLNNFALYLSPEITKNITGYPLLVSAINAVATNGEKKVFSGRLSHDSLVFGRPNWSLIKKNNFLTENYQVVLATSNFGQFFKSWENNLIVGSGENNELWQGFKQFLAGNYSLSFDNQLAQKLFSSQGLLMAKKSVNVSTSSSGFLNNYDWVAGLKMPAPLDSTEKAQLENILKLLVANQYPRAKKVALNDGSYITEFRADTSYLKFIADKNVNSVISPDGVLKIYYKTEGNDLYISNNLDILGQNITLAGNYFKIGVGAFNFGRQMNSYLSGFSFIQADDSGLAIF